MVSGECGEIICGLPLIRLPRSRVPVTPRSAVKGESRGAYLVRAPSSPACVAAGLELRQSGPAGGAAYRGEFRILKGRGAGDVLLVSFSRTKNGGAVDLVGAGDDLSPPCITSARPAYKILALVLVLDCW